MTRSADLNHIMLAITHNISLIRKTKIRAPLVNVINDTVCNANAYLSQYTPYPDQRTPFLYIYNLIKLSVYNRNLSFPTPNRENMCHKLLII